MSDEYQDRIVIISLGNKGKIALDTPDIGARSTLHE